MPPVQPPEHQMDTRSSTWNEVHTVKRARSVSAPATNGIPHMFCKNTLGVLRYLWKLMVVAWKKVIIPQVWHRAAGILIPKKENSSNINQFHQINLLNVEGKIFFSVVAQRLSTFLMNNNYIDSSVPKTRIGVFSTCL